MFVVNEDNSIYATRGDIVFFSVSADDDGATYHFKPGDVVRFKVYGKKNAENVVLQKDFPVTDFCEAVNIQLTEADTKFGDVISKPTDYWYEVELNPFDNPQTIIGYDEDGAKVFKLFPEGGDVEEFVPDPEDIPVVDEDLDLVSPRPVQNQAIARAFRSLEAGYEAVHKAVSELYVTPEMFGAIGDGEAHDTEAFQDAIDRLNAGDVFRIPNGTYFLSDLVTINKDITIVTDSGVVTGNGFHVTDANVTIRGVSFKDIETNAIVVSNNANVTVEKCRFENVGTMNGLDITYQGCGIHAADGFELRVYDCFFKKCHGHGAVFCHNEGVVYVKDSHFEANDYRAICLFGGGKIVGSISRNHIEDCGKYNETGSGVACNGIYSTNGMGVTVENNTILNSRENAIEGVFLKVAQNYIYGTGVEIDAKPTPSNEGIYIAPGKPAVVENNIILKAGSVGIKSFSDAAMTEPMFIVGNIIRDCGSGAIDINSVVKVSNVHIIDNVVDDSVSLTNFDQTSFYAGDIYELSGKPNLAHNNATFDLHHYFTKIEPFTYDNCTPTIGTENGVSHVRVPYQEYAKLIYTLPYLKATKHLLDFTVLGKGRFNVNLYKNGTLHNSILQVDSDGYVEMHNIVSFTGSISDTFKIYIEFAETSNIRTVDVQLYR